jgi:hypothetical protein
MIHHFHFTEMALSLGFLCPGPAWDDVHVYVASLLACILPLVECFLHASPEKSKKPGVMFRVCILDGWYLGGTCSHPLSLSYVIFYSQLRQFCIDVPGDKEWKKKV